MKTTKPPSPRALPCCVKPLANVAAETSVLVRSVESSGRMPNKQGEKSGKDRNSNTPYRVDNDSYRLDVFELFTQV
jgi:hypothetical protein